jgi:hypothetical protein
MAARVYIVCRDGCLFCLAVENIHYMRRSLDALQKAAHGMPESVDPLAAPYRGVVPSSALSTSDGGSVSGSAGSYGAAGWSSAHDRSTDTMSAAVWGKVSGFLTGVLSSYQAPAAAPAPPVGPAVTGMPPSPQPAPGGSLSGVVPSTAAATTLQPPSSTGVSTPRCTALDFDTHGDDGEWLTAAGTAGLDWLRQSSLVLSAAVRVVSAVDREGVSVLVHCSDGWDRTSQVCALAQLLMDPYFRTFAGFEVRLLLLVVLQQPALHPSLFPL